MRIIISTLLRALLLASAAALFVGCATSDYPDEDLSQGRSGHEFHSGSAGGSCH